MFTPKYLNKREFADLNRVSEATVSRWLKEKKVRPDFYTPGGAPRFRNPEYRD